ncbi:hypothetical protein [Actinokineospora sp.]|uniref:hypothetical protein n=1 Tax=Actinokineospora sp. TaxID=1872133 RepID=UPI003D6AD239
MADGKAELVGIGTTDPATFEAGITKVGEKLQAAVKLDPAGSISHLPEAVDAFNTAPTCKALARTRMTAPTS